MSDSQFLSFRKSGSTGMGLPTGQTWKVLSVDDDPGYQETLKFALQDVAVAGRPVEFMTANSAAQAATLIAGQPDIAVILLDVVMEDDDAGLRLVGAVRDVIGNDTVRIILLTGQPGMAPRRDVMSRFDIDDYWCKSEISNEQLLGVVSSNVRTWDHMVRLTQARKGLLMVVDACKAISAQTEAESFSQEVLRQIARILDFDRGGIACIRHVSGTPVTEARVVAATGTFARSCKDTVAAMLVSTQVPRDIFNLAMRTRAGVHTQGYSLFYFSTSDVDGHEYLVLVEGERELDSDEIGLLQVFSENVNSGFKNVALHGRLSDLAYKDSLLGIPNRNLLLRELTSLSANSRQEYRLVTILVDYMRDIVVTFGEGYQRQLLGVVYEKLKRAFPSALIARLHDAAFAMLVPDKNLLNEWFFQSLFSLPLQIDDGLHMVSTTVATLRLAEFADVEPQRILSLAETYTSTARHEGRRFRHIDRSGERAITERYALLNDLRTALKERQFSIVLQPKVGLEDGCAVGMEALVRWRPSPDRQIFPDAFIPLAETTGLIDQLDRQVLELTCDAVKAFEAAGLTLPIAFNVSSLTMSRPVYFEQMLAIVRASKVAPPLLDLELTESAALRQYEQVSSDLRRAINLGMNVSIDDFGTGYSSLNHFSQLPATTLKIDRGFVERMVDSTRDAQLVSLVVQLGLDFGFKVVAEGIETGQQRDMLLACGCQFGQGYFFAKPLELEDAITWAREHQPKP